MKTCIEENCNRNVFTHNFCKVHSYKYYKLKPKKETTFKSFGEIVGMESSVIQKYRGKSVSALKNKAVKIFHAFIRERDAGKPCISCGNFRTLQAGHFHSAGRCERLRFNEDNVHGQCVKCNYFEQQSDTLYRANLVRKIGQAKVDYLDFIASIKDPYKTDKLFLIQVIEKYSVKELKV